MLNITDKTLCSGCFACSNSCPQGCITMQPDEEGFLYPQINNALCINCSVCEKKCPIITEYKIDCSEKTEFYAAISKDIEIRLKSSSGGIFSLIAEYVIDKKGIVFGAAFDNEFNVIHIGVDSKEELHRLRGSKYIQSNINNSFILAKQHLDNDRLVLFSGTPCQIGGFKAFLGREYDNLICQDIVCHGVPSPYIWQKYKKLLECRAKSKISSVEFRNKKNGWKAFVFNVSFENNSVFSQPAKNNLYFKAFLKNLSLRKSCYNCHFKSVERVSDITLADLWGVDEISPQLNDNKGVSLIITHTQKGAGLLEALGDKMKILNVDRETCIKHNLPLTRSVILPTTREIFMKKAVSGNLTRALKKYTYQNLFSRAVKKTKVILRRFK